MAPATITVGTSMSRRAGVDYRRYVLGRLQGATINASGGATDDYLAFSLGVLGGK